MTAPLDPDELTVFRWSPEDDNRLTELVSLDEHSFSEIGKIMGLNKSKVIGRFYRIAARMDGQPNAGKKCKVSVDR